MENSTQSEVQEQASIDLLDVLQIIADNLRLLVLAPLVIGLIALAFSFSIKPIFVATTTFIPPQQNQGMAAAMLQALGAGGIAGSAAGIKNPSEQYVALIESNSIKDLLIEKYDLIKRYEVKFRDDARKILRESKVRVSYGRKDGLITVSVEDHDPIFAAELANAHIQELSSLLGRIAVTEAQGRRVFFEKELKKAKDGLVAAEAQLKTSGVGEFAIKASPESTIGAVASIMARITALEIQIQSMRNYLTQEAPEIKRANSELLALRGQLDKLEKDRGAINSESDYVSKYRNFKYYEMLFDLLAKQFEIARIDESRSGVEVQVVDVAKAPNRKVRPRKAFIAIVATLISGFFLLAYVIFCAWFNRAMSDIVFADKVQKLKKAVVRASAIR